MKIGKLPHRMQETSHRSCRAKKLGGVVQQRRIREDRTSKKKKKTRPVARSSAMTSANTEAGLIVVLRPKLPCQPPHLFLLPFIWLPCFVRFSISAHHVLRTHLPSRWSRWRTVLKGRFASTHRDRIEVVGLTEHDSPPT